MRTPLWLLLLCCALFGCATANRANTQTLEVAGLSGERLLVGKDEPVLFLGADADAPAVGYASSELVVRIVGRPSSGRVPVEVAGPLALRAHVPIELLTLRVQRRGRLRDTPVYVAPNDRVRVLGPASEPGRVRVSAAPLLIGLGSSDYEGTYPVQGLATKKAPPEARPPEPGAAYQLAAGRPFSLFDAPGGKLILAPKTSPLPLDLTVLRQEGAWFAVRVGEGPYLVGYTNSAIKPRPAGLAPVESRRVSATSATAAAPVLPARLLHERGALKRVVSGTQLYFNDAPIAVLRAEAWARVLTEYPHGEVDAFVAVDDSVAVRALLPRSALRDAIVPALGSPGSGSNAGTPSQAARP